MVTLAEANLALAEAITQTSAARSQLGKTKVAIREREMEIRETETGISSAKTRFRAILPFGATLKQQLSVSKQLGVGGVAESLRRSRRFKIKGLKQVGAARQELVPIKKQLVEVKGQVSTSESQLAVAESQIKKRQRLLADIRLARKLASRGSFPFFESKRVRKFFVEELSRIKSRKARTRQLKELKKQGLTPVFVGGKLAGFESEKLMQSFALENLGLVQPSAVAPLEKVGLITVERVPSAPTFQALTVQDSFPPGVSEARARDPGRLERFGERLFLEMRITEPPRFFGSPRIKEVSPVLALGAIAGQEIAKGLEDPIFGRLGRRPSGIFNIVIPKITAPEQRARELVTGFGGRVTALAIPKTPEAVAITAAVPFVIGSLPTVVGRIGLASLGAFETREAFKPGLTIEERTVAGLSAGLAFTGAGALPTKFQIGIRQLKSQARTLGEKGVLTPEAEQAVIGVIKELKFFRRQPDVPITKPVVEIIPRKLTQLEKEAFAKVLLAEDIRIFGGQAEALRGIRGTKDIDIGAKESQRVLAELAGQLGEVSSGKVMLKRKSIGLGGEKAFDIKPFEILKGFPLSEKPVKTAEGIEITKLSEQLSRSLAGTLELRKGGKDIGSVVLDTRAFLSQASTRLQETRFPFLKPFRQRALARAERAEQAFEQFTLPEVELQVARFARTKRGKGVKIVDLPQEFRATTRPPGFAEIAEEFGKLFPAGKRAQIGGIGELPTRVQQPKIKFEGFRRTKRFKPSELEVSFIRPRRIRPSVFRPLPALVPSGFEPSMLKPPKRLTPGFEPSILKPGRPKKVRPGLIIKPVPSEFGHPPPPGFPGASSIPGVPTVPGFGFPVEDIFGRPRRRKDSERKIKKKKPRERKIPKFPISVSFTASALGLKGKFPKQFTLAGKKLGFLPQQIRVIPSRKSRRR